MELYNYQKEVARHLRRHRNIILQAPTGSGKTFAALWPYLERWEKNDPHIFPRRCIYSVPMRILAKQFVLSTNELIQEKLLLTENPKIEIQTGDRPNDRQFEADLIFTTIDQSLSSLLAVPYALSGSKRNLNAGAIIGSYLVFDEYHLFPTTYTSGPGALGATLEMLKLLKGIAPFCLMTATFSENMLTELANLLEAEVVKVSEEEMTKIETDEKTGKRKERRFQVMDSSISAEAILQHPANRIIAVCNRVDRAQNLYQELVNKLGSDERIILLHARFLRDDRNHLENIALKEFGKKKEEHSAGPFILVATQVIEVGLDLSCDVLHTEVAPANAIIQRAGRCARRPGETGQVFIYPLPDDSSQPHLPYEKGLCDETLAAFAAPQYNGQIIRFAEEQAIINLVHNQSDQRLLDSLRQRVNTTLTSIENAIMLGESAERRDLVRAVNNRTLLVHDQPEQLGNPLRCEGFAIFLGSLKSKWSELEEWADQKGLDWALRYPKEVDGEDIGQTEPEYLWKSVTDKSLLDLPLPFAIHPALVAYDAKLGFRFTSDTDGLFRSAPAPDKRGQGITQYTYNLESYEVHIGNMLRIYRRDLAEHLTYAAYQLEQQLNLKPGAVDQAARLVIALHDIGKLNQKWQDWAKKYQQLIGEPLTDLSFMVAHTLNQTEAHRQVERKTKKGRPHHAGEGAAASVKIISEAAKTWANSKEGAQILFKAMLTAIARHHNAGTDSFDIYQVHSMAELALGRALAAADLASLPVALQPYQPIQFDKYLVKLGDDWWGWFLYFLLVRALILADHKSLAEGH